MSSKAAGVLSQRALNRALLSRQLLLDRVDLPDEAGRRRAMVIQAIEHLVGLQAQAPFPPYHGLWSRLGGFRPGDLSALLTDRSVVRIALMRGTIHMVSARDCLPLRRLHQPVLPAVRHDPLPGMGNPGDPSGKAEDLFKKSLRGFLLAYEPYIVIYIVLLFPLRRAVLMAFAAAAVSLSVAGTAVQAADAAVTFPAGGIPSSHVSSDPVPDSASPGPSGSPGSAGSVPRQELVPDLIAAVPGGITSAQVTRISKLGGVVAVLPVDGGKVRVNGKSADVLGVSTQAFRPWTPLATAASAAVWSDLSQGQLISTDAAASKLHLTAGKSYPVSAAVLEQVPFGGPTALSVPGADAIVNLTRSAQLGLAKNFAVLINAPTANLKTLIAQVQSVIGKHGQVVNLVSYTLGTAGNLPVEPNAPAGVPANWIDLFKASAAKYCPGLSWTVLAAIGEIESGDGANEGPSSAGAEGPMQFLPSTWAIWGTDGFGQTGAPNILNAYDAVPSAARLLCAAGGGNTATLAGAIFAYNHAAWYVNEVLALASEYARNNA